MPVVTASGAPAEVSLTDVLLGAHELLALHDGSPLVTAAMHRMLLAVLHRAYRGPRSAQEWAHIWGAGRFDPAIVGGYLVEFADRFDLFGARPFYQRAGMPAGYRARPVAALAIESAAYGAVPQLFDGTPAAQDGLSCAQAARLLVAHQAYALGGLTSRLPGESASAAGAPLPKAAVLLLTGASLFATLALNLARYGAALADRPAWERGPTENRLRRPAGSADWLTWQSRRLRLLPPGADGIIRHVQIAAGWSFPATAPLAYETMVSWRRDARRTRSAPRDRDWKPVAIRAGRAVWSDSVELAVATETGLRARTLDWVVELAAGGHLDPDAIAGVDVLGLAARQFKLERWSHERLPVPAAALLDPERGRGLAAAMAATAAVGRALWSVEERAVPGWRANLDLPFRRWGAGSGDLEQWCRTLQRCAWSALRQTWGGSPSGRELRERVMAERLLGHRMRRALEEGDGDGAEAGPDEADGA